MEQELIEITIGAWGDKLEEITAWAVERFGDQVEPHNSLPILYFRNQADATMFALKWS